MFLEVQTVMQKRDKYKNPMEENLNGCIIYDLSMRIHIRNYISKHLFRYSKIVFQSCNTWSTNSPTECC